MTGRSACLPVPIALQWGGGGDGEANEPGGVGVGGGAGMSRRDFVVVGAWMGWLSGCAAGLYVLLRQFEDSKASTQYLIEHRGEGVLQCIAGAIGASIAVTAFLHLARLRKVRLGPPGEQEKIGVGCYTLFLVWMAWALISTLVLK